MQKWLLLLFASGAFHGCEAQLTLDLDGSWDFALDPSDPATARLAAGGGQVSGTISVPGAWQAQGYGEETATMKHQYMGVATYNKKVSLPTSFSTYRVFVVAERIQRSAKLFIGDKFICEHTGYTSSLDCEVTSSLTFAEGSMIPVRLVVNSTRHTGFDGLVGTSDLDTDGSNLGGWGGLGGHVKFEARARKGYMANPWIRQAVSDSFESASVNVSVEVHSADLNSSELLLRVALLDSQNQTVGTLSGHCKEVVCQTSDLVVHSPQLWSPSSPTQYTAKLTLVVTTSGEVLDQQLVRIGFRRLEVFGYHWKLNGAWLYLHGYGDDSIYPVTMSPPLSRSLYNSRLAVARKLGFNFVRHHSHILPDEYFDSACELGMLVSAEFPIEYGGAIAECPGKTCDSFYEREWSAVIRRLRNRPCVFDYTMNNEDVNQHDAPKLYAIAKALDPTRPVNTADGVWGLSSNPQDFLPKAFQVLQIPMGDPHQFHYDGNPPAPVIVHEMGNFVTWPRLDSEISSFKDNIKPYWLTPARNHVLQKGLLGENELWSRCSRQLFLFCWKNQIEGLRKTEKISGYEWWLLQDFWMGSNGILDTYFVSKHPAQELDEIKALNGAVLLLVAEPGDNLPLSVSSARFLRGYSSNDTLRTSLHVSNHGPVDIVGAQLSWQVVGVTASGQQTTLCSATEKLHAIASSPNTSELVGIECALPNLGSFANSPQSPLNIYFKASLQDARGENLAENQWRSRVYATASAVPARKGHKVYTMAKFCSSVPIMDVICGIPPPGTEISSGSVFIVDTLDANILDLASAGGTVLMLKGQDLAANFGGPVPSDPAVFKTAWWLGGGGAGNNMGTVVYNSSSAFTGGMAPDGWADEGWFNLIQGGREFILDDLEGSVDILIRSIDIMGNSVAVSSLQDNPYAVRARSKALLWQASVVREGSSDHSKRGALIASGLNLLVNYFRTSLRGVSADSAGGLREESLEAMRSCACIPCGVSEPHNYGAGQCNPSTPTCSATSAKNAGCFSSVSSPCNCKTLMAPVPDPAAAWLLYKLLDYAFSSPKPVKTLEARITKCPTCMPNTTWTVCPAAANSESFV